MDGVLLKVCNREGRCCTWSPDATASHILTLRLSLLQALMSVSIPLFVSSPCFTTCYWLHIFHSQPSKLLQSGLPSIHIVVVLQMSTIFPSSARVSLISSKYPTWCRSTFEPCRHDLICACVHPSCSVIQENVIFDRAEDRFSLEVLTPIGDVILDIGS
jgi:hypothetical protein